MELLVDEARLQPPGQEAGKALGLPEGVGDALAGRGVLEVAGVADQAPAGPCRLAEVPLEARHHDRLADAPAPGDEVGQGKAACDHAVEPGPVAVPVCRE